MKERDIFRKIVEDCPVIAARDSYYTIPASDLLIFDLRHGTILARNK
mgnify:CR=1 FL=1